MAEIVRLLNRTTGDDRQEGHGHRITWDQFVHALGADPMDHELSIQIVRSDAMDPTIRSGEIVLIDRSVREVTRPGVYLFDFHGIEALRRVAVLDRALLLSCDTRRSGDDELVPHGEVPALIVLGLVRSVWRRV